MLGPKVAVWRSRPYRMWVATHECFGCRIEGYSQAAHENAGKGGALKTGDDRTFPLCCTRPGKIGCHVEHDQCIDMTRDERNEMAARLGCRDADALTRFAQSAVAASLPARAPEPPQASTEAPEPSLWLMRDGHTFLRLPIHCQEAMDAIRADRWQYGMLFYGDFKRSGPVLHFRNEFPEQDVLRWLIEAVGAALSQPTPPPVESVGEASSMPGTNGFTMACFKAADVPVGSKLYLGPPPVESQTAEARDAARLQFLEEETNKGFAPNLVFDDDGNWAVSYAGFQPAPGGDGKGFDEEVGITVMVDPKEWRPSIREAIDAAIATQAAGETP